MSYVVTAEFVTIRCPATLALPVRSATMFVGLYRGQPVPENALPESVEHHLATGQIAEAT